MGIGMRHSGGGGAYDGASGGVACIVPREEGVKLEARAATTGGEGCDHGRELELKALEGDSTLSSSIFFHSTWRVKSIIPSILHPVMLVFIVKATSHAFLNHSIKCV
jgi:hypothetical protein